MKKVYRLKAYRIGYTNIERFYSNKLKAYKDMQTILPTEIINSYSVVIKEMRENKKYITDNYILETIEIR